MKEDTPKAGQREVETRRIGFQDRLKEKVVDAKHDQSALDRARQGRFKSTGEPSEAPGPDDVRAERAATASKGSKSKSK